MNLIFDAGILLVIVLSAWIGKKRGFIKTFFSFFGSLISLILASVCAKPVGAFLSEKYFEPVIHRFFVDAFLTRAGTDAQNLDFSALPEPCKEFLQRFRVSSSDLEKIASDTKEKGADLLDRIAGTVAAPLASSIGYAVAFLGLFLIFLVVLRLLVKLLDLISKLPGLNFSNRVLGLLAGIALGLVLAVLLSSLIVLSEPLIQRSESAFLRDFDSQKTVLVRFFSSFDVLHRMIG